MSEALKIVLTAGATVVSGIVVLVFGQIITRFYIDPLHALRYFIGELPGTLGFHANVYSNPGIASQERLDETSRVLRERGTTLRARAYVLPSYNWFARRGFVPPKQAISEASHEFVGLSNSVHRGDGVQNSKRADKIRALLGLPPE